MANFLKKLFGSSNEAEIKRLRKILDKVNALEPKMHALRDEELRALTPAFKDRLQRGETLDDLLPEAFAAVREAAGARHRPEALRRAGPRRHRAASGPHRGDEDRRGQNADRRAARLPQRPDRARACTSSPSTTTWPSCHAEWMGKIYRFLGLTRGPDRARHGQRPAPAPPTPATSPTAPTTSSASTTCATTWSSTRSDMVQRRAQLRHRGRGGLHPHRRGAHAADHLRPAATSPRTCTPRPTGFVLSLRLGKVETDEFGTRPRPATTSRTKRTRPSPSPRRASRKAERFFNVENLSDLENTELYHHILAALKAHALMQRDVDYVVKDGEVHHRGRVHRPPDGRAAATRDGLHQAIEAKEGVKVERESQHAGHHHLPELLPHVQQALRHDRYGQDRGGGVPGHLQPGRGAASPPTSP